MTKILLIGGTGYIGSYLFPLLAASGFNVDTMDLEWFGNVINIKNKKMNYNLLTKKQLKKYDVIILLAGFSSVRMTTGRMMEAFKNDVDNFVGLLNNISDQKLIYASSSSIYGNTKKIRVTEDYNRYSPLNHYDLNKKIIDYYAQLSGVNYYGLRLGTVCGFSKHLRTDLMINKMFTSAIEKGYITIYNPAMQRPILGLNDLYRAVRAIIKGKSYPGIYNLASFNATIGEVSKQVSSEVKNVKVIVQQAKSLYNFSVDTTKFESVYAFKFTDTTKTILNSLKKNYNLALKTVRE